MKSRILLLFLLLFSVSTFSQDKKRVLIDADTGNEVDDLYAVVRGLTEPTWEVVGLNATQWQVSHWAVENTMEESYRLNDVLLSYLKLGSKVASKRGAEARLFDWGNKSQTSAASSLIIKEAMKPGKDKLNVIALGALTNVASAILDEPSVASKIRLYWLGTSYDFEQGIMKNIDFNCVMDVQAVDVILNSNVELHIIPVNVAAKMTFDWKETVGQFKGKHDLTDFLLHRWYNHLDPGVRGRTIWDLSLIEAIIHPEFSEEVKINTSKEKGKRQVWMYKNIDADQMRQEFFRTTLDYLKDLE